MNQAKRTQNRASIPTEARRRASRRSYVALLLVAATALSFSASCKEAKAPRETPPTPDKVKPVPRRAETVVSLRDAKNCRGSVHPTAETVCPLLPGQSIPSVTVRDIDGKSRDLAAVVRKQPTLLIVYRGGW
ncbi:MAG: hypothetical protein KC609_18485 [Myxococcales bacterium]|nr:hypothetical protein [Myxococcales bacterium]